MAKQLFNYKFSVGKRIFFVKAKTLGAAKRKAQEVQQKTAKNCKLVYLEWKEPVTIDKEQKSDS